jgi:hypothetical protein
VRVFARVIATYPFEQEIPFAGWTTVATLALVHSRLWVCCDHMLRYLPMTSSSPTRDKEQSTPLTN